MVWWDRDEVQRVVLPLVSSVDSVSQGVPLLTFDALLQVINVAREKVRATASFPQRLRRIVRADVSLFETVRCKDPGPTCQICVVRNATCTWNGQQL